jgi:hypothetical protein
MNDHECEFKEYDCDLCRGCKEHASFCESCGSDCCGEPPVMQD